MALPQGPNQHWSLDFASDALVDESTAGAFEFSPLPMTLLGNALDWLRIARCQGSGSLASSTPRQPLVGYQLAVYPTMAPN